MYLVRRLTICKVFWRIPNVSPVNLVDSYVDEAQDNLLIDALCKVLLIYTSYNIFICHVVLRFLVRNPDGLFWAGDTAQTISVGSSFRFNDLKAFLFRLEVRVLHLFDLPSILTVYAEKKGRIHSW